MGWEGVSGMGSPVIIVRNRVAVGCFGSHRAIRTCRKTRQQRPE